MNLREILPFLRMDIIILSSSRRLSSWLISFGLFESSSDCKHSPSKMLKYYFLFILKKKSFYFANQTSGSTTWLSIRITNICSSTLLNRQNKTGTICRSFTCEGEFWKLFTLWFHSWTGLGYSYSPIIALKPSSNRLIMLATSSSSRSKLTHSYSDRFLQNTQYISDWIG